MQKQPPKSGNKRRIVVTCCCILALKTLLQKMQFIGNQMETVFSECNKLKKIILQKFGREILAS